MLPSDKTILVTGANGFIGKAVCMELSRKGMPVRACVRSEKSAHSLQQHFLNQSLPPLVCLVTGDLSLEQNWQEALQGVDTVIHCAALAHTPAAKKQSQLDIFKRVNADASENLALQAKTMGVRRFIFLSSIGVLGNSNQRAFNESSAIEPKAAYAQAKWEAEQRLSIINGIEMVIIRPPLVYGQGARGNFNLLLKLIQKQIPMPFASIRNSRQFIGIHNLVDFMITCIDAKQAANQVFVIADNEIVSTSDFIRKIAKGLNQKTRMLPIPTTLLRVLFNSTGMGRLNEQLLNNLEIDTQKAQTLLKWQAPYTIEEQIQRDFCKKKF